MKQIVETQICDNAYAKVTDLNKNATYYWTVEAENYSAITPSKWNNTDEVYSFTTEAYESIDTAMLRYYTELLKREANKLKEAKEPGCFPEGSKQELLDAVAECEKFFSYTEAQTTQKEIDNQIEHLKEVYTSVATSMYIKDADIDVLMPNNMTWYGVGRITQGTGNPVKFNYDEETGIFKIESTINQHTAITKDELSDGVIRHYKMKVNFNETGGWFGIAEKGQIELEKDQYFPKDQQNIFNYGYAVPAYMMLINERSLEFHNRSNKNNLVIDSMANSYIKDGEWFDLEMGVVTTLSGDQFIVRINGKEIYNKSVDTATIMKPGKMYIFFSKKGMSIEIKKDENFTEGEVYSMMDKKDVSGIAGTQNEIISIGDILNKDKWTANNTTAEFGADFIKTEATGTEFSSLIYNEKKIYNAIANLDTVLKLENDNAFTVSLRASEPESPYNTKSNDNYYFSIKNGYVDVVHRESSEQLLARIPNNGIYTNGERTNIQAGVVDCEGGVRVVLYVNGTCMLDMIDANASFASGSLVLYDRKGVGMEIYAPSMSAITIEDIPNEAYVEKGIVVTQQAAKKSSGSWSETQKAVNGVALAYNKQEDGTPATMNYEIAAPGAVYHVYYWSGITYVGDENVKVTISSHYDGNDRVFNINNKYGKTGWIYLGAYATSDFYIRAMVEGSGNGTLLSGGFKKILLLLLWAQYIIIYGAVTSL